MCQISRIKALQTCSFAETEWRALEKKRGNNFEFQPHFDWAFDVLNRMHVRNVIKAFIELLRLQIKILAFRNNNILFRKYCSIFVELARHGLRREMHVYNLHNSLCPCFHIKNTGVKFKHHFFNFFLCMNYFRALSIF